jgi:uncharacterized membrane protein
MEVPDEKPKAALLPLQVCSVSFIVGFSFAAAKMAKPCLLDTANVTGHSEGVSGSFEQPSSSVESKVPFSG